ncbi:MAG: cytochrome c biogenesis protein CcsA, partial [Bacteroidia bacterium]|nr:cytochrome c biogenesis protein CcsA [Bacteroidia bacterium]
MLLQVPKLAILHESIRNLYYHVPMWFSMIILFTASVVYSISFLNSSKTKHDTLAKETAAVGFFLGILGLLTGMVWARFTWGAFWVADPKLNGALAAILVYAAYFLLRNSMDDEKKRSRIAAVYSIFAYVLMLVFIMVIPRLTASLHPGSGGNPGFNVYDLDSTMRLIFYPAVIGWTLLATWIVSLKVRMTNLKIEMLKNLNN